MGRSTNQKILLVLSIIEIVVAALIIIMALLSFTGGALLTGASGSADVASTAVGGTLMGGAVMLLGIGLLVGGIISLIIGILGVRAANDNRKIMPVWVLAIIELVFSVISAIMAVVNGADVLSSCISLTLAIVIFVIANNIKKERDAGTPYA